MSMSGAAGLHTVVVGVKRPGQALQQRNRAVLLFSCFLAFLAAVGFMSNSSPTSLLRAAALDNSYQDDVFPVYHDDHLASMKQLRELSQAGSFPSSVFPKYAAYMNGNDATGVGVSDLMRAQKAANSWMRKDSRDWTGRSPGPQSSATPSLHASYVGHFLEGPYKLQDAGFGQESSNAQIKSEGVVNDLESAKRAQEMIAHEFAPPTQPFVRHTKIQKLTSGPDGTTQNEDWYTSHKDYGTDGTEAGVNMVNWYTKYGTHKNFSDTGTWKTSHNLNTNGG